MTDREYVKLRAGATVRTLVPLSNQLATLPAGALATVLRKRSGFDLQALRCTCCGVAVRMGKVPPSDVELVSA